MSTLPMVEPMVGLMTDEEVASYGRGCEGFGALQTERGLLPLVAMQVDARVNGVICATSVAQTFVNTTGSAIEATYIFPLPDRAAVHAFVMEVNGRRVDGVIEERGAAREQYDEAIAAGHRAAITEEERAGVFTLRVGNLMPSETAVVKLSLVGPLPVDDGEVTFRFPLVVAPRYMPGNALGGEQAGLGNALDTDLVPDASRISPPVRLPGCPNPVRLALSVALEDHDVRDVSSSLHAVTASKRDAMVVEVQPGERLDRDFILRWHVDGKELRSSLVCADDADGKAGTFLLTLVPPSTTAVAQKPRDVVFVIDRSGSMGGWKMVAARRAAARMIDTLTSRDRFCAIAFDDSVEYLPGAGLVDATDRNRYKTVEALAQVESRGGTELAEPLRQAAVMFAGGYDDRERVIVLVTDGQVGNEDHILREMAPNLRNVRMFTLGIDQAVNAAFLKRLASAGGGLCELVESEDRLDAVMAKVHRRIGMPIATELVLRPATGVDVDLAQLAPKKLPDVYAGAPVTILGRYRGSADGKASIEIEGTALGDPLRVTVTREASTTSAHALGASWARARIRDLEDAYATGERNLEGEIVATSKRFSVLSRFTAFLAIDRSQVVNAGGQLKQIVQPVDMPAGWDMQLEGRGGGGTRAGAPIALPPKIKAKTVMVGAPSTNASAVRGRFASPAELSRKKLPLRKPAPGPMQPGGGAADGKPTGAKDAKNQPSAPVYETADGFEAERSISRREQAGSAGRSAYHAKLETLARELARASDPNTIRAIRQRLTEWIEDVRSVGGHDDLAAAVEKLVQRLSAALTEAAAVAAELQKLASGASAPPKAPKAKSDRAFWK
jgi:Ca-activated chloride channel family protein